MSNLIYFRCSLLHFFLHGLIEPNLFFYPPKFGFCNLGWILLIFLVKHKVEQINIRLE